MKELKKCYYYLDLPFSATEEDVRKREKVLIKIWRAKGMKKGVSYASKIHEVALKANTILQYIETNGAPKFKEFAYETSKEALIIQSLTLFAVIIVAFVTFFSLI